MRLENWFISNPDASQQEVLKVPVNQNLIVKGVAGSGKTNMAIYSARQAGDNTFVIVVYTVALKRMVRYGLSELGLDKDRVVHKWSWIRRGIEISGDLFCMKDDSADGKINGDFLILKTAERLKFFVTKDKYDSIVNTNFEDYSVLKINNPLEVSIDFDDWVEERFYRAFYRRSRWFKEVQLLNFQLDPNDEKFIFIPAGYLFKEKGVVNYVIVSKIA